ncbi:MAG: hypothetical protein RR527_06605 [Clostridia bacterium]
MKRSAVFMVTALVLILLTACRENSFLQPAPMATHKLDASEQTDGATWQEVDPAKPIYADLNGDGIQEEIRLSLDDNECVAGINFIIGGTASSVKIDNPLYGVSCHIADTLEDDKSVEFYITGDMASDDYVTYIYRVKDGKLECADIYGIATMENIGSGTVSVNEIIDVLGTYSAVCKYELQDEFAFVRSTPYTIERNKDGWSDRKIVVKKDGLPAKITDEDMELKDITLPIGTQLALTETDCNSYALLQREDGVAVLIEISKEDGGWGWSIGGIAEEEWFEELMYAG